MPNSSVGARRYAAPGSRTAWWRSGPDAGAEDVRPKLFYPSRTACGGPPGAARGARGLRVRPSADPVVSTHAVGGGRSSGPGWRCSAGCTGSPASGGWPRCRLNLAFLWFLGYDLDERPRTTRCCRRRAPCDGLPGVLRRGRPPVRGAGLLQGDPAVSGQHAGRGQRQPGVARSRALVTNSRRSTSIWPRCGRRTRPRRRTDALVPDDAQRRHVQARLARRPTQRPCGPGRTRWPSAAPTGGSSPWLWLGRSAPPPGLLAGYLGGWVETVLMRLADAQLALPRACCSDHRRRRARKANLVLVLAVRPGSSTPTDHLHHRPQARLHPRRAGPGRRCAPDQRATCSPTRSRRSSSCGPEWAGYPVSGVESSACRPPRSWGGVLTPARRALDRHAAWDCARRHTSGASTCSATASAVP